MSHRINVVLNDEIWQELQTIPAGERSRLVNESLSVELLKRRRLAAMEQMQALRQTMKPVPGRSEDWVRADRESH